MAWFTALEASGPAAALRGSVWAYPLINAAHLLGIALLIGALVPLDLRLLGLWPREPWAPLYRVLSRCAAVGLLLAGVAGALLFLARADEYADSGLFQLKMLAVALGALNALAARHPALDGAPPQRLRLAAGVSLAAWLCALILGRMVGYF